MTVIEEGCSIKFHFRRCPAAHFIAMLKYYNRSFQSSICSPYPTSPGICRCIEWVDPRAGRGTQAISGKGAGSCEGTGNSQAETRWAASGERTEAQTRKWRFVGFSISLFNHRTYPKCLCQQHSFKVRVESSWTVAPISTCNLNYHI